MSLQALLAAAADEDTFATQNTVGSTTTNAFKTTLKELEMMNNNCPDISPCKSQNDNNTSALSDESYYNSLNSILSRLSEEDATLEIIYDCMRQLEIFSTTSQCQELVNPNALNVLFKGVDRLIEEYPNFNQKQNNVIDTPFGNAVRDAFSIFRNVTRCDSTQKLLQYNYSITYLVGISIHLERQHQLNSNELIIDRNFNKDGSFKRSFEISGKSPMMESLSECVHNIWLSNDKKMMAISEEYYNIVAQALINLFALVQDRSSLEKLHNIFNVLHDTISNQKSQVNSQTTTQFSRLIENNAVALLEHFTFFSLRANHNESKNL